MARWGVLRGVAWLIFRSIFGSRPRDDDPVGAHEDTF